MPLLTVYITNFNYDQYIRQAVESVLSQSFDDLEIVIIDDGSTDNSRHTIETHYANHEKIRIIYQQNKGLNVSNNVAMQIANGKYIMRLDADDYLAEGALGKMVSKLEEDDKLGLVFPDYYYVDGHGKVIGHEKRHDFDNEVTLFDQPAHGACTMIRLEFLKQVGGYNESYNCQDGYELWVKFIQHYPISNLNEPLFYYRQHGNNLTKNENRILDTRAKINANFVKEFRHNVNTLAIIPIRGGDDDLAFHSLAGQNLLIHKLERVLEAENISKVVVSSPDERIKSVLKAFEGNKRVHFHHRPEEKARYNVSLIPTLLEILDLDEIKDLDIEALTILTIEYPFVDGEKIDDAINTMVLFGSDSLIAVRPDHAVFYQHHGDGLHAIMNRDKYTKLEREALFKQVGGISVVKKKVFLENKEMITGKVGHMVLDQKSSFGLFTSFDWQLAELMMNSENVSREIKH
jgi:glycosyltransferase involved in cell wall biosynthesis